MLVLDDVVILIGEQVVVNEETLQEKMIIQKKNVFANILNIGYREYYEAKKNDFELSFKVIVSKLEYENEQKLEYNNKRYSIVRAYVVDNDFVELTCEHERT